METRIPAPWRPVLRLAWAASALLMTGLFITGVAPRYRELAAVCREAPCIVLALAPEENAVLEDWGLSLGLYAGYQVALEIYLFLVFTASALLLFRGRSDTVVGYIVSLALTFMGTAMYPDAVRSLARFYPPVEAPVAVLVPAGIALFLLLFFLFPDGRFAPPWLWWVPAGAVVVFLLDQLVLHTEAQGPSTSLLIVSAAIVCATVGIGSQVYRYLRVSGPVERQQTKWVLAGFISMFAMSVFWSVFVELFPLDAGRPRLLFNLTYAVQIVLISLFPISMLISIRRYRLWDIDLVIRRTLQYALLTGLLALVYFGGVVVLQALLGPLTGAVHSPMVTVLTTLAIAALFSPLRTRVQAFIDRRLYRQKYDAEQSLARFAAAARSEVDMDRLTDALLGVVEETMQPERAEIRLR